MVAAPAAGASSASTARPQLADCAPSGTDPAGRARPLDAGRRLCRRRGRRARAGRDLGAAPQPHPRDAVPALRRALRGQDVLQRHRPHVGGAPHDGDVLERADGDATPLVEAVALWVHLDPERRLPSAVTEAELEVYGSRCRRPQGARTPAPSAARRRSRPSRTGASGAPTPTSPITSTMPPTGSRSRTSCSRSARGAHADRRRARVPHAGAARTRCGSCVSGARRWITEPDGDEVYASTVLMNARDDVRVELRAELRPSSSRSAAARLSALR